MGFKKRRERGKSLKYSLAAVLIIMVAVSAVWLLMVKFEGRAPEIELGMSDSFIGADAAVSGTITDEKSGIRKLWIAVMQNDRETVLKEESDFAGTQQGPPRQRRFEVDLNAGKLDLKDGKALLRIAAWDHSWRSWFSGNQAYLEKEITIDTQPPRVEVISRQHNIRPGGSGLAVYRMSEDCPEHGVVVGDHFFPGHKGYFADPDVAVCFFALAHDQDRDTKLHVQAVDPAGNSGRGGFYYHIRNKGFDAETLPVSDRFLSRILPEFQNEEGFPADAGALEQFLFVNRELRKKNNRSILAPGRSADEQKHWQGGFSRLPNAARKASFADHRTYVYKGEKIDEQIHMGIDLASVSQAPVPAANAGKVAFVGRAGIYGNVVTIDHGFGLFSVYTHLSRSSVSEGRMVEKNDIIGATGATGLAGGDHLHYGMFVHDVFVDPMEWWDSQWIQNNITGKLEHARELAKSN